MLDFIVMQMVKLIVKRAIDQQRETTECSWSKIVRPFTLFVNPFR